MKHVVWKAFADFEKEEKYLNEMSAKGLAMTDYTWCRYVFQDAPKGEYIYRIELLENPVSHAESQNYIKFMEETGVEFVASYGRWVYFRKKAADGEFDIYTDVNSRLKHYKRIRALFAFVSVLNLFIGIMNFSYGAWEVSKGILPINSYFSIISLGLGTLLLIFIVMPISKKIDTLNKEKDIRE